MTKIIGGLCAFIVLLTVLILTLGSWGTIDAGHRGIVLRMGAVTGEIKGEGFYSKTPWTESVVETSVQVFKAQDETEAATSDLQIVRTVLAVNFRQNPDAVAKIYQRYGTNYIQTFIDPSVKETAKAVIARFTAEHLISQREKVRLAINDELRSKLEAEGFVLDTVNIINFAFSEGFSRAVEAKVTAEQNALAAKNKLDQVKFEAQQAYETAAGKAKAIEVESKALQSSPQILQLRALEKWDGRMPQVVGSGAMPFIELGTLTTHK
jgi:regulator of protease activity HflC (stomatin/prohibitin superfamily)